MANQYDTNLKLQAIADAIGDSSSSGLISALEDIADAVAGGGGGGSSTAGLVSDNFSETDTYDLGDYCIHNNTLYVCINAISTPGPWDLSDWQATNAGMELSSLNSALTDLEWKPLGSAVLGNVVQNLPSNWVELLVTVGSATPEGNNRQCFSFNIHSGACSSTNNNYFTTGFYYNANINACMQLKLTGKSTIQLVTATLNSTDVINNMTTGVFYKT